MPKSASLILTDLAPASAEAAAGLNIVATGAGVGRLSNVIARFDDIESSVAPIDHDTVIIAVPAELPAGKYAVMLLEAGDASNALPFELLPRITGPATTGNRRPNQPVVTIPIAPRIVPGQRVKVLLDGLSPPPGQRTHSIAVAADPVTQSTNAVRVNLPPLPGGNYLLRLEVDGATSRLTRSMSDNATYSGPLLTIK